MKYKWVKGCEMKYWKLFISTSLGILSFPTYASASSLGKPVNLIANNAGRFFFDSTGPRDQRPACATFNRWVIDATTDQGWAMMALMMTAKAQDKKITVYGTGDCRDWADTESIAHFVVHD